MSLLEFLLMKVLISSVSKHSLVGSTLDDEQKPYLSIDLVFQSSFCMFSMYLRQMNK